MKILMLTPYLPYPPSSGGQVRSYNLIKHLSRNNQIHLVSLIKSKTEEKYVSHLKKYCEEIYVCKRSESPWTLQNITKSMLGPHPFLVVRNFSPEAKSTISKLLKDYEFDLIHAETFYIMPHIPDTKIPILLVEQTIEYRVYQHFVNNLFPLFKPAFFYDILKLKRSEKTFWQKANLVGAVSADDKASMLKVLPNLKIEIIPNAAGEDLFNIYDEKRLKSDPIFLYQGNFSWLQNTEAAQILTRVVYPKIKKKIPNAQCLIAGQNAQSKVGHLAQEGVEVIDMKPSNTKLVQDVFKRANVFLAPIEGPGGTRLKILGAMAAGLPVISSPTGVTGLDVEDEKNVLIAQTANDFVRLSVDILSNKALYRKIKTNARKLIEDKYSWPKIAARLERVYLELKEEKE